MKHAAIVLAGCVLAVSSLAAEQKPANTKTSSAPKKITTTTPAPKKVELRLSNSKETSSDEPANENDSPLVRAARSSRGSRNKSKISITDADVKSTSGHFATGQSTAAHDISSEPEDPHAKQLAELKAKQDKQAAEASQIRVETARKRVTELELDLRRLEENYYNETDTHYRDDVLEQKYSETRDQLNKARQELSDALGEQQKLPKQ